MAENSIKSDGQLTLDAHLQFAVRSIEGDPHLRVLVRHYLAVCSSLQPSSVFDQNPIQNAYNQGYQAAGIEFASMLTAVVPNLIASLLHEETSQDA